MSVQEDAKTYLKRWTDNKERLDYVLSRAGDRMSYFTHIPDDEFVAVVNETLENLQYIRLLHACEHNMIPDKDEFYRLKIAAEGFDKVGMIKALRAMFHTTLAEADNEIRRVFNFDSYGKMSDPFSTMIQVENWEFNGVLLGFFEIGKESGKREWNWRT